MGFKWCFDPIEVIFFEIKNFLFPKKLQVFADPVVVNFFETTGSSLFISPNGQGYIFFFFCNLKFNSEPKKSQMKLFGPKKINSHVLTP